MLTWLQATLWHAQFSPLSRITLKICRPDFKFQNLIKFILCIYFKENLQKTDEYIIFSLGFGLEGPGLGLVLGLWILALTTTLPIRSWCLSCSTNHLGTCSSRTEIFENAVIRAFCITVPVMPLECTIDLWYMIHKHRSGIFAVVPIRLVDESSASFSCYTPACIY